MFRPLRYAWLKSQAKGQGYQFHICLYHSLGFCDYSEVILNGVLVYLPLELWGYIEWYTCIFYSKSCKVILNGILVYLTVEMSVILNGILVYLPLELWGYIEWYTCIFDSRDVRLY